MLRQLLFIWTLTLGGCVLAPAELHQVESFALPPPEEGVLPSYGEEIAAELQPGESAFWLLDEARFSLDARLALIDHAQSTLDVQYFIWEDTLTGRLLARRLIAAAERGVRVRLLLDDLTMSRRDWEYVALESHPLIEVRTFNPWKGRRPYQRVFEFMLRHKDLNRRMHVKTVLADGQFAVIGGRNIGDRYFGLSEVFVQNDLDIMAAGPMIPDVIASFDEYWNNGHSYPVTAIARKSVRDSALADFATLTASIAEDQKLSPFPSRPANWTELFAGLSESFAAGRGQLSYDPPVLDRDQPRVLRADLLELMRSARESVAIVTAYLIPDDEFIALLEELAARDVSVKIVTNSLATNNHLLAHTAYRRWRRRLLGAGVDLYELRADAELMSMHSLPGNGASWLGLHSKAIVVDNDRSFVGSPNIDPRSLLLNLEIGFFVESAELAERVLAIIDRKSLPENAWRVTMNEEGWLKWSNADETVTRQPAQGFKQRFIEFFTNLLPLKNQA